MIKALHGGCFQVTHVVSLHSELGSDPQDWLSQAGSSGLQHTTGAESGRATAFHGPRGALGSCWLAGLGHFQGFPILPLCLLV